MSNRLLRIAAVAALAAILLVQAGAHTQTAKAVTYSSMAPIQKRLVSGLADLELNPNNVALHNGLQTAGAAIALESLNNSSARRPKNYYPSDHGACPITRSDNIKVNQNCLNCPTRIYRAAGRPTTRPRSPKTHVIPTIWSPATTIICAAMAIVATPTAWMVVEPGRT